MPAPKPTSASAGLFDDAAPALASSGSTASSSSALFANDGRFAEGGLFGDAPLEVPVMEAFVAPKSDAAALPGLKCLDGSKLVAKDKEAEAKRKALLLAQQQQQQGKTIENRMGLGMALTLSDNPTAVTSGDVWDAVSTGDASGATVGGENLFENAAARLGDDEVAAAALGSGTRSGLLKGDDDDDEHEDDGADLAVTKLVFGAGSGGAAALAPAAAAAAAPVFAEGDGEAAAGGAEAEAVAAAAERPKTVEDELFGGSSGKAVKQDGGARAQAAALAEVLGGWVVFGGREGQFVPAACPPPSRNTPLVFLLPALCFALDPAKISSLLTDDVLKDDDSSSFLSSLEAASAAPSKAAAPAAGLDLFGMIDPTSSGGADIVGDDVGAFDFNAYIGGEGSGGGGGLFA